MRTPFFLSLVALLAPAASAQQVLHQWYAASGYEWGRSIVSIPDTNGDGATDLLIGGPLPGGTGSIWCFSGKSSLYFWGYVPSGLSGDANFGSSLASVGDLTGDGIADYAVGAPGDDSNGADAGAVYLVSGSTHVIVGHVYGTTAGERFGHAIHAAGDMNGDGEIDLVVGCPYADAGGTDRGKVYKVSGAALASSAAAWGLGSRTGTANGELFGFAVFGGSSIDADADLDVVASSPGADVGASTDAGKVWLLDGPTLGTLGSYSGAALDQLGRTLDASQDFDGDGRPDVVAGAPLANAGAGRALVLSSARVIANNPPLEIFAWSGAAGEALGSAVGGAPDLSGDGFPDVLVGAVGYGGAAHNGAAYAYSGETGLQLARVTGANNEYLGDSVLGTTNDMNANGVDDFIVCGSTSDAAYTNGGVVKWVSLLPVPPVAYCTGKTSSLGCVPAMSWTGNASLTSALAFDVRATSVLSQKTGLLFYGFGSTAVPFQGGYLCVEPPTVRTPLQSSGGTAGGGDCTGVFSFDFNDWIQSGIDPNLTLGQEVFCQYWSRDPASPSTTSLSNAARFLVQP